MKRFTFAHITIGIWFFLLLGADLKVSIHSYIHWGVSILVFALLFPYVLRFRGYFGHPIHWFVISMAILLMASILLSSLNSDNALYGVGQALKIGLILLLAFGLMLSRPTWALIGFSSIQAAVWANFILLVLGLFMNPIFASQMASDGRWGTFLNHPGSLWRVGILVLVFSAYVYYYRRKDFRYLALLVVGLCLIYADSSRTGFIITMIAVFYTILLLILEQRRRLLATSLFICAVLGIAVLIGVLAFSGDLVNRLLPQRAAETLQAITSANLESADPTRFRMLQAASQAIAEHPLWGTGIGTTRADTDVGPMVVHNTYLQVWSDLGLLGFLAYLGLVIGWVAWLPRFFLIVSRQGNVILRGLYYNAAFLLFFYALTSLFHPLSTEWSEWITFMLPFALYAQALQQYERNHEESGFQYSHNYI
ncbi:MAG: O-antigen ligase family protein [Deinococcota bacterium]